MVRSDFIIFVLSISEMTIFQKLPVDILYLHSFGICKKTLHVCEPKVKCQNDHHKIFLIIPTNDISPAIKFQEFQEQPRLIIMPANNYE